MARIKVWTVTCPECNIELYSRARYDYRMCGCPSQTMVDGGFSGYIRYGGANMAGLRASFKYRFVPASKQELYNDWASEQDKFGVVTKKGS